MSTIKCPECLGKGGYEVKWSGEWLTCPECNGKGELPYPKTTVVHIKKSAYDVYIGRAGHGLDGYFGNPHPVGKRCFQMTCGGVIHDRESAIAAYKKDFDYRIQFDAQFFLRVLELRNKRLGCFCKPLPCHGDVIKQYLDNLPS